MNNYWERMTHAEAEAARLRQQLADPAGRLNKITNKGQRSTEGRRLAQRLRERYDEADRADIALVALSSAGDDGQDISSSLLDSRTFSRAGGLRDKIHELRDLECAQHLKDYVLSPQKCHILRLANDTSQNDCHLMHQTFKFNHERRHPTTGKRLKQRELMAADSVVPAPEIFRVAELQALDSRLLVGDAANVQHEDLKGSECKSVMWVLVNIYDTVESAGAVYNGWSTSGAEGDEHWMSLEVRFSLLYDVIVLVAAAAAAASLKCTSEEARVRCTALNMSACTCTAMLEI